MSFRRNSFWLFFVSVVASCTALEDEPALVLDDPGSLGEDGDVASLRESLTKGAVGAANGDKDYCDDPSNPCLGGEGDCDAAAQCTAGTRCLPDNGAKFGFPSSWDVCAPLHCSNKRLDAGQGETSTDCGGPCGSCVQNCVGTPGGKDFCASCFCGNGEGDCDSNAEDIGASYIGNDNETAWKIGPGITSEGFNIFRWRNEFSDWEQINGGGVRIDLSGLVPWVVTNAGRIKSKANVTTANPNGNGWTDRGNLGFIDVGVNYAGTAWALGGTPNANGDYDVYRNTGGTTWVETDGDAVRIDVASDGTPWVVTAGGGIYRRIGVTASVPNGTGWSHPAGPIASDIAVGREDAVWITDSSGGIHQRHTQPAVDNSNPPNGVTTDPEDRPVIDRWQQTDGAGVNISVGIRSLPWVTASDLSVWRRRGG